MRSNSPARRIIVAEAASATAGAGPRERSVSMVARLLCIARGSASILSQLGTRIVSAAGIRLDHRKSVRPFKGIFCDDISEFSHPRQAVGSLQCAYRKRSSSRALRHVQKLLFGAENFDKRRAEPAKGRVVVITFVPINANVEGRHWYW